MPKKSQDGRPRALYGRVPEAVLRDPTLGPGPKVLYGVLDRHWRSKEGCWPTVELLAEGCGVKVRVVKEWLAALVKRGLVRRQRRKYGRSVLTWRVPLELVSSGAEKHPTSGAEKHPTGRAEIRPTEGEGRGRRGTERETPSMVSPSTGGDKHANATKRRRRRRRDLPDAQELKAGWSLPT